MRCGALVGAVVALWMPASGCSKRAAVTRPAVVALDTSVVSLKVGDIAAVGARALEERRRQNAGPAVTWWSSDSNVATVSPTGLVTGVGTGIARAWAKSGKDSAFAVVVVAAKPVRYGVVPSIVVFDALGATAELAARPAGTEATCKSDADSIAIVERGTFLKSRGNGSTRVRCRVGSGVSTAQVEVRQRVARISIRSERGLALRPARDTFTLSVARVDRLGQPVANVRPEWATLNPAVATVDRSTGALVGIATGEARVVATVGALADTARVEVREDAGAEPPAPVVARRTSTSAAARRPAATGRGPARVTTGAGAAAAARSAAAVTAARIGVRDIAATDSVFTAQAAGDSARSRMRLGATAVFGIGDHRVDAGGGLEKTGGMMFGTDLSFQLSRRFLVHGSFLTGTLSSADPSVPELKVGDVHLELDVIAFPWLTFLLGGSYQGYSNAVGATRWTSLFTGAEARFSLLPEQLEGWVRLALLPVVSVQGLGQSPNLSLAGAVGLDYRTGRFGFGLEYQLERHDFPAVAGVQRREQLSVLRLKLGLYDLLK